MTRKREPRFVPQRPVPDGGDWGRIVLLNATEPAFGAVEAIERIDHAVAALEEAMTEAPDGVCRIDHPVEARRDAVGFWRRTGGERLIHRYAGLSKATAPIDPFRRGSKADETIRCEIGNAPGGEQRNPVRCAVLHDHGGGSTEVTITTGVGTTPYAPWHEHSGARAMSVLLSARSLLEAMRDRGTDADGFHADALCQAVRLIDPARDVGMPVRSAVAVTAPSPLARGDVRVNWSISLLDPAKAGVRPLVLPDATAVWLHEHGNEASISIMPMTRSITLRDVTPIERLRAEARIVACGYRPDGGAA